VVNSYLSVNFMVRLILRNL